MKFSLFTLGAYLPHSSTNLNSISCFILSHSRSLKFLQGHVNSSTSAANLSFRRPGLVPLHVRGYEEIEFVRNALLPPLLLVAAAQEVFRVRFAQSTASEPGQAPASGGYLGASIRATFPQKS